MERTEEAISSQRSSERSLRPMVNALRSILLSLVAASLLSPSDAAADITHARRRPAPRLELCAARPNRWRKKQSRLERFKKGFKTFQLEDYPYVYFPFCVFIGAMGVAYMLQPLQPLDDNESGEEEDDSVETNTTTASDATRTRRTQQLLRALQPAFLWSVVLLTLQFNRARRRYWEGRTFGGAEQDVER